MSVIDMQMLRERKLIDPMDLDILLENPEVAPAIAEKYLGEMREVGLKLKAISESDGDSPQLRTRTRELSARLDALKSSGLVESTEL